MQVFHLAIAAAALAVCPAAPNGADPDPGLRTFPAADRAAQTALETSLRANPTADSLQHWHELLCSEPHIAGTPADLRNSDRIAEAFAAMGLEVEKHEVWAYLCRPISAVLEVAAPEHVALGIKEEALAQDTFSQNPDLLPGWNAYSGNGDVTAGVVYANYGAKADFQKLKDLGVDCTGKIVIARYGSNFRGYKAKFAQAAGAAGLVIFTDPSDSGYCKGIMYPEGGYANDTCIQRGSLNTLDWDGDALTPMEPATKDAKRLDPATIDLPKIPVQPIGWGAAKEILSRMTGAAVPEGWQGGLPFTYRLTGGDALKVHLKVEQERFIAKTYNVIGILRGSTYPEQLVLIGAHHDAWGYGAADPCCGTITVLEAARAFTQIVNSSQHTAHGTQPDRPTRPLRSIAFCAWAAEEFGLIGSVEWVEANRDRLFKNAVAYINLDMASMGMEFGASCAPSMRGLIIDAARSVPQPSGKENETVFDAWLARGEDAHFPGTPKTGDIGGGSDHVGFNCHLAVSAAGLGASGSKGNSYHSVYDNLQWYWKVVGSDYASAIMVTRMTSTIVARLACSPLIPLDPVRPASDVRAYLAAISKDGLAAGLMHAKDKADAHAGDPAVAIELAAIEGAAVQFEGLARRIQARMLDGVESGRLTGDRLARVNALILQLDRDWFIKDGLPGRPWFRSLLAATDEDSGYSSWMLPALRRAVERRDAPALAQAEDLYLGVFTRLSGTMREIDRLLTDLPPARPAGETK